MIITCMSGKAPYQSEGWSHVKTLLSPPNPFGLPLRSEHHIHRCDHDHDSNDDSNGDVNFGNFVMIC